MQEKESTKMVTVSGLKDLAPSAFQITISRVQQEALKQAGSKVPTPSEQLALIAERRVKKTQVTPN